MTTDKTALVAVFVEHRLIHVAVERLESVLIHQIPTVELCHVLNELCGQFLDFGNDGEHENICLNLFSVLRDSKVGVTRGFATDYKPKIDFLSVEFNLNGFFRHGGQCLIISDEFEEKES